MPAERDERECAPDDAVVVARVLGGDTEQFAVLVRRHQAALYRHAVSMVLDHDEAADMVQEAFVRAYTSLATCRDPARFRAWLFRTLRNRCLDYLKDGRRKTLRLEHAGPVVDTAETPDARVERAGVRHEIMRALDALPAAQREAFLMHCVQGLSYEAMGDLLDASVSALKMRVLRAREALACALRNRDVTSDVPNRLTVEQR